MVVIVVPSTLDDRKHSLDLGDRAHWQNTAPSPSFITLPVALQFLGLMAATIPASLIMGKLGRRLGFSLGNLIGIVGASLATYALSQQTFYLFCFLRFCSVSESALARSIVLLQ